MKTSLAWAAGAFVAMLTIAGCAAETAPSEPAGASAPLHSTYVYEGSTLELTGKPLSSGGVQVQMHLVTPTVDKTIAFDPATAGDELAPELQSVLSQMSPAMIAAVRDQIASAPTPSSEVEARWAWLQGSVFMVGGSGASGTPHDSCTSIPGGYWDYCPKDNLYHCCVFAHEAICAWLCTWM